MLRAEIFAMTRSNQTWQATSGGTELLNVQRDEAALKTLEALAAAFASARTQGSGAYSELGRAAQAWSGVATKATLSVLAALSEHQRVESTGVASHARAEQAKSLASLAALKHTAVFKALEATAAGFRALGSFDFWAAGNDFAAAALYGTLAGAQIASMSGASAAGGSRARSERGFEREGSGNPASAGVGIGGMAAGAMSAARPPSGNLTVAIMGDSEAGEWLASTLNTAVEQRGVQLTATRSTRSAYAQG